MYLIRRQNGYTFVELVIAIAILGLFLTVVTSSVLRLVNIYQSGVGIRNTQQTTRYIGDEITRASRQAAAFAIRDNTRAVQTSTGDVVSPQDTLCSYTSTTSNQGTIFYVTQEAGTNRFSLFRAAPNPAAAPGTCDPGQLDPGVQPQRMNSPEVSIARFDVQSAHPSMIDYELSAIAVSAVEISDIRAGGLEGIECIPQIGSQFCAITHAETSLAIRLRRTP